MGRIKNMAKKLIYSDGVNPLPTKLILCLFMLTVFVEMVKTMVFSFLPKLIKSFGIKETDVGYNMGLIVSSLYVGRLMFDLPIGYLADKKGGKRVLLVLSCLLAVFTIMFGFSYNFVWTITTRFLQGCTISIEVITRSLIRENCDETNIAYGMAVSIAAFSFGIMIGPSIAGWLVFPDELYPNAFKSDSIFAQFPILLPCLLFTTALIGAIFISVIYLPPDKRELKLSEEKRLLVSDNEDNSIQSLDTISTGVEEIKSTDHNGTVDCCETLKESHFGKLVRTQSFLLTCIVYGLVCFNASAYDEIFPLYAATTKKYHGFAFSTKEIGNAILGITIGILVLQFTLIPRVLYLIGPRKIFIYTGITQALLFPVIPTLQLISNKVLFWIVLLTVTFIIRLSIQTWFVGAVVMLNNSIDKSLVGMGNGCGTTMGTLGRVISTYVYGAIFSWSLKNMKSVAEHHPGLGFPFNHYFVFLILSVFALIGTFIMVFLPDTLNTLIRSDERE